jgi:hypothetical protein
MFLEHEHEAFSGFIVGMAAYSSEIPIELSDLLCLPCQTIAQI